MAKSGRPKYQSAGQYKPPTPEVFGSAMPDGLPEIAPKSGDRNAFSVDRPRNRPKLADRLAVYEDDNPKCQQTLCLVGIFFPPLWLVGAAMYANTAPGKTLTREAGFKNMILSIIAVVLCLLYGIYHLYFGHPLSKADPTASGVPPRLLRGLI
eukprot:TRINITY_DN43211_c0_g1_i1.p1 TRINITY_DN43211_c0_g1~~TRINITY_DN43211_c0_g1_i1.p1  ORF type:complete len:163 (-),score=35.88 TRINITY_DN43211_c0_g1_i1:96-554(-)